MVITEEEVYLRSRSTITPKRKVKWIAKKSGVTESEHVGETNP